MNFDLRIPQQSAEAEQAVLGALLLDNTRWACVAKVLAPAHFYHADNRLIFEHIGLLIEMGEPADALTVAAHIHDAGKLDEVGGHAYIGSLAINTSSATNVLAYAKFVRERAQLRKTAEIGRLLVDSALSTSADAVALRRDAEKQLAEIADDRPDPHDWPAALDLAALALRDPLPLTFIVSHWLPSGYATLLAGHGGVGKSGIALHLAVCAAVGLPFFGLEVSQRRVLYLSCEDRENILHWRLARICAYLGVNLADLEGKLRIVDLVGRETVVYERDPRTGYTVTTAFARLEQSVRDYGTELLVVDGITDTFAGLGGNSTDIKRYINRLVGLIPADRGAVLLIGHVAKLTAGGSGVTSEGYSGAAGWHNSVRARWYLYPETVRDDECDRLERTGDLLLELQKSNLGRTDQELRFRWDDDAHLFICKMAGTSIFDRKLRERDERAGILAALQSCASASPPIIVPTAMQGPRTAFHVISIRPNFPKTLRGKAAARRFRRHIEEMRQLHLIAEREYRRSNRHVGMELILTVEGMRQCAK